MGWGGVPTVLSYFYEITRPGQVRNFETYPHGREEERGKKERKDEENAKVKKERKEK